MEGGGVFVLLGGVLVLAEVGVGLGVVVVAVVVVVVGSPLP